MAKNTKRVSSRCRTVRLNPVNSNEVGVTWAIENHDAAAISCCSWKLNRFKVAQNSHIPVRA